jgi:hypothetical protein
MAQNSNIGKPAQQRWHKTAILHISFKSSLKQPLMSDYRAFKKMFARGVGGVRRALNVRGIMDNEGT